MRKLFALLFVAGTLALASCGGEKKPEETATTDSSAAATEVAPAPDSTAMAPDTTKAADSVAAPAEEKK